MKMINATINKVFYLFTKETTLVVDLIKKTESHLMVSKNYLFFSNKTALSIQKDNHLELKKFFSKVQIKNHQDFVQQILKE